MGKVFGNELVELVTQFLGDLGVAIAREVDEAPVVVDFEEVDLAGPAGSLGDPGEAVLVGEEINQGRLADVGATDEGELRKFGRRALG